MGLFTSSSETVPCTIEVSHRFESLHAHLRFDNGAIIHPGDEVIVAGAPVSAPFGKVVTESRQATIRRASALKRAWTRATGDLGAMELCEFSFSDAVRP
ncbi:hypothetical protein [Phaeovulum vinaykumarii]|uniref:Uncharacterized protein n=1 Tax=Phaeovulum vinaykumarii TaxID=407234 RepID=A0A1N7L3X6_9RHOB|nr:hypothetical protein [Phaeovulum vinaykumarii]SIS68390.1 hypothetical protein SAMN05421795_102510 [Phaeovulum vinaykumarii]SOC00109.1 hypothetical protein SAMN05878426_102262 [Phaeovulum vinaykumarii]